MVSSSSSSGPTQPRFGTADRMFFGGFASGLDTASIIDALVAAASRPVTLAQQKLAVLQNRQKALGQINSSLANLASTLDPLRNSSQMRARQATITSADDQAKLSV